MGLSTGPGKGADPWKQGQALEDQDGSNAPPSLPATGIPISPAAFAITAVCALCVSVIVALLPAVRGKFDSAAWAGNQKP